MTPSLDSEGGTQAHMHENTRKQNSRRGGVGSEGRDRQDHRRLEVEPGGTCFYSYDWTLIRKVEALAVFRTSHPVLLTMKTMTRFAEKETLCSYNKREPKVSFLQVSQESMLPGMEFSMFLCTAPVGLRQPRSTVWITYKTLCCWHAWSWDVMQWESSSLEGARTWVQV